MATDYIGTLIAKAIKEICVTRDGENVADALVSIALALNRIADVAEAQNENATSPKSE